MKRLLVILLASTMLLTLCACNGEKSKEASQASASSVPSLTAPPADSIPGTAAATPEAAAEVATAFLEAYYTRDYATRFPYYFYDARQKWEDTVIKNEGSAEAFFAIAQQQADERGIEAKIDSFDSYFHFYYQFILNDMKEMYGDYTLSVKVVEENTKKLEGDTLTRFRDNLLGAIDDKYIDADALRALSEFYVMTVNIHIDGTKKDYNEYYRVYTVYQNGRWLVVEHSI